MTELCPHCGCDIQPPDTQGGRPRRWCSPGCQRSGEARMRRINGLLKRLEGKKSWNQLHGHDSTRYDEVIAEWQQQYDHLAGCPQAKERKETNQND
jgi:hypothetical protein